MTLYFYKPCFGGQKAYITIDRIIGRNNFYIKNDTSIELLVQKKYLKKFPDKNIIIENKKYIGQLLIYLQDCENIQAKLNTIDYRKGSIEKLFEFYYSCTQTEVQFQKKSEKISLEFGVLAGVSLTSLNFTTDHFSNYYLSKADYNQSVNFSGGVFFDLVFRRNQRKWSISNELLLSSYKIEGQYGGHDLFNSYTEIGYSYLKLNNMLRYKYPIKDLFVFVNAGISNGLAMDETNYQSIEYKYISRFNEITEALEGTRKYEQGLLQGIGTKFKNYSFEIRFEKGNGMSMGPSIGSRVNRFYSLLAYKF